MKKKKSFSLWLKENVFARELIRILLFGCLGFLVHLHSRQVLNNRLPPPTSGATVAATLDLSPSQNLRSREVEKKNLDESCLPSTTIKNPKHIASIFELFSNASFLQRYGECLSKAYLATNGLPYRLPFATINSPRIYQNATPSSSQRSSQLEDPGTTESLEKRSSLSGSQESQEIADLALVLNQFIEETQQELVIPQKLPTSFVYSPDSDFDPPDLYDLQTAPGQKRKDPDYSEPNLALQQNSSKKETDTFDQQTLDGIEELKQKVLDGNPVPHLHPSCAKRIKPEYPNAGEPIPACLSPESHLTRIPGLTRLQVQLNTQQFIKQSLAFQYKKGTTNIIVVTEKSKYTKYSDLSGDLNQTPGARTSSLPIVTILRDCTITSYDWALIRPAYENEMPGVYYQIGSNSSEGRKNFSQIPQLAKDAAEQAKLLNFRL